MDQLLTNIVGIVEAVEKLKGTKKVLFNLFSYLIKLDTVHRL